MGKVVTKEWTKVKSADIGFVFVLAAKIIQALDSKPGSCNQTCISFHLLNYFAMGDDLSYELNTLGPLCLWQCLH